MTTLEKSSLRESLRDPDRRGRLIWFFLITLLVATGARWTAYALGESLGHIRWIRASWASQLTFPISLTEHPLLAVSLGLAYAVLLAMPLVVAARSRARNGVALAIATMVGSLLPIAVPMSGTDEWPTMLRGMLMMLNCIALLTLWAVGPLVIVRKRVKRSSPLVRSAIAHMGYVAYFVCVAISSPGTLFHLPWMIAIALSFLLVAAVLHTKDWGGVFYRWLSPAAGGALLIGSLAVFYVGVGADEREFPLMEIHCKPRVLFPTGPLQRLDDKAIGKAMGLSNGGKIDFDGMMPLNVVMTAHEPLLTKPRRTAIQSLDDFLAKFPRSKHAGRAMAIKGRILDTRLHMDMLKHYVLFFYEDRPNEQSQSIWLQLAEKHSGTPWAFLARVRLAQWTARRGDWPDALRRLPVEDRMPPIANLSPADEKVLVEAWLDALRLRQLITENCDDPAYGDRPLTLFAAVDPREWDAVANFHDAAGDQPMPNSVLDDNLKLLDSRLTFERDRYAALRQNFVDENAAIRQVDKNAQLAQKQKDDIAARFRAQRTELRQTYDRKYKEALKSIAADPNDGDAACEALLLLARQLDTENAAAPLLARAIAYYRQIISRFAHLPLARFARHRLEKLT